MTSPATPPAQYLGFRGDRRKTWLMPLAERGAGDEPERPRRAAPSMAHKSAVWDVSQSW
jgi:hypothetical protein